MKEFDNIILREDLAKRFGVTEPTIDNVAKRIGFETKTIVVNKRRKRRFTVEEALLVKNELRKRYEDKLAIPPRRSNNNLYKSYQRLNPY